MLGNLCLWASFVAAVHLCCAFPMLPSPGQCPKPEFADVFPGKLKGRWFVVRHTDSMMPHMQNCYTFKFNRRSDFGSDIGVTLTVSNPTKILKIAIPISHKGNIKVKANKPMKINLAPVLFPSNMMITELDEKNGCMAFWSRFPMGLTCMKGAWVLCKNTKNIKPEVIAKLQEGVSKASKIGSGVFIEPNFDLCN